jgi:hypothetical protein
MIKHPMYAVVKIKFPGKKHIYKVVETTSELIPENQLTSDGKKHKGAFAKETKCEMEVASNLRDFCEWWIDMQAKGAP